MPLSLIFLNFIQVKKILCISGVMAFAGYRALAQGCAVCSNTSAALDDKGARGLNGGIIYLAFLPLTIMLTLGYIWWRANKSNT
jgi:hypothetical protein